MSVYVDSPRRFVAKGAQARRAGAPHGHVWCHLLCEPGQEEELHRVAAAAGMQRQWFQPSPPASFPHYDLLPPRRKAALEAGAVEMSREQMRRFFARWRKYREKSGVEGGAP